MSLQSHALMTTRVQMERNSNECVVCIEVRCVRKKNTAAEAVVEKKKKNSLTLKKKWNVENYVFFLWPKITAQSQRFTLNSLSTLTNSFIFTFDIKFYEKYAICLNGKLKITNFFFDSLLLKSIHTHNCRKHTEVGRIFDRAHRSSKRRSIFHWVSLHKFGCVYLTNSTVAGKYK